MAETADTADTAEPTTTSLPVLPLTTGVVGPTMVVTLALETAEARAAADDATASDGRVLLVPRIDGRYASVGTVAKIEQDGELPGGGRGLVVRGLDRAVIGAGRADQGRALWVEVEPVDSTRTKVVSSPEIDRLVAEYRTVVEAILEYRGARQLAEAITGMSDPHAIADLALYSPDLDFEQKVTVLETLDVEARLRLVLGWSKDVLAELSVRDDLRRNLEEELSKEQREAVLRRQMASIQRELDDGGDAESPVGQYRAKLAGLTDAGVARDGYRRARQGDRQAGPDLGAVPRARLDPSPGSTRCSTYPGACTLLRPSIWPRPAPVLDADHDGLDKVKERIVEYLAVRKLRADRADIDAEPGAPPIRGGSGTLIALVGPPGVGKTSLGASIAKALGRPFARVALGGVRDEAEIRGHRRTYVGARPGRLVKAIADAGTMNPVLPARRDRQGRLGLAGRSVLGAARGAGPGPEPHRSATTTSRSTSTCPT